MLINIRDELVEVDDNCVPLVQYFNNIGLDTKYSCEGHKLGENFEVMFEDYIKDEQIVNFIKQYSNKCNHTPFCGQFVKWVRKMSGQITFNWIYVARDKLWAARDYETMISKSG